MIRAPASNRVLASLPRADSQRLLADCEPLTLPFGKVLYEPGKVIRHVYFPIDCLVSLLTPMEANRSAEVGLVGREGMLGIPLALGVNVSPVRAMVQGTGTALRVPSVLFRSEHGKHGRLYTELSRYIHELLMQVTQTAACNLYHSVESRLARWLLMMRDRMGTNQFRLTQELLGDMLGVLRVAVTIAAGALQRRKLITYSRGVILIVDDGGLEEAACMCYQMVRPLR